MGDRGMDDVEALWQKLEKTGEEEVRQRLDSGQYGSNKIPHVKAWLKKKEAERAGHQQQHQEAREEQALNLAREANEISRGANQIALWALIAAGFGVVISLIALFSRG